MILILVRRLEGTEGKSLAAVTVSEKEAIELADEVYQENRWRQGSAFSFLPAFTPVVYIPITAMMEWMRNANVLRFVSVTLLAHLTSPIAQAIFILSLMEKSDVLYKGCVDLCC